MSASISVKAKPVADPRGVRKKPIELAPRLSSLKGQKVLLFDNSQMTTQIVNYGNILKWFGDALTEKHGAICSNMTVNLFEVTPAGMAEMAKKIADSGVKAAIVALCKFGMTQPTSMFIAELERCGVASVQVVTKQGPNPLALASTTAASYMPGLPIAVLDLPKDDNKETFGKDAAEAVLPDIIAGLTSDKESLLKAAKARFALGEDPTKDGKIELSPIEAPALDGGGKTLMLEPGGFALDLYEKLCAGDLCDGLPVIPPTESRVNAMLGFTDFDPEHVLIEDCQPSGSNLTVRSVAINAVMAGCKPDYMPILVAAFQAIADPRYRFEQAAITTHPGGNAILVSGPLAKEIGIHSGPGCLGHGFRANATIGRAVNLTVMNVTRSIPNKSDLSAFGSPAEFTYCFAESDEDNPWQPLHTDLYGADVTSVTVHKAECPHNVLDPRTGSEALLRAIAGTAATPGGNNLYHLGQIIVFLNPAHAEMIANDGWTKRDIKEFLFETARLPQEITKRRLGAKFPKYFHRLAEVPVLRSPDDVYVIVAGGRSSQCMVALPWGFNGAVNRPVTLKDGYPLKSIKNTFSGKH